MTTLRAFLWLPSLAAIVATSIAFEGAAADSAGRSPAAGDAQRGASANRLIRSNNPYLLSHAHNPVDWYPWGPEALEKARRENRPIFVSFGYSTCYWCHVAERTLYSDPAIAKLMNQWFVNIKVDREQRPDLDSVYILATRIMTGRAGWPNNVFLTPDLKPFFGGSYFPPGDDAFGRPGFPAILKGVHEAWTDRRALVLQQAQEVHEALLKAHQDAAATELSPVAPDALMGQSRQALLRDFDHEHGGFGRGPAKFPRSPALALLLADYRMRRDPEVLTVITRTLDAMALGGIRDHLGGGFHRYSTDPTWSVPHFEKMLYDNGQLLQIYADAFDLTKNPLYRQVAKEVADYLLREMTAREGGLFSAQDAEVGGREGISYVWSREEIRSILGTADAERFFRVYELRPLLEPAGERLVENAEHGVLRVRAADAIAQSPAGDGKEIARLLESLAPVRGKLLAARNRRAQPARDEKIIVAWNAMAIAGLVRAGAVLSKPRFTEIARKSALRLWRQAYDPRSAELKHEIFRGRAQVHGYLDDYALLAIAFLEVGEASAESVWRERAARLSGALLRRFVRGDTLATTVAAGDLPLVPQEEGDNAAPSGTSAAIELLLRLNAATGDSEHAPTAARLLARLGGSLQRDPERWPSAVVAVNRFSLPQAASTTGGSPPRETLASTDSASTEAHVRVEGEARLAGDRDTITVVVHVASGYHVNANPASSADLIATRLSVGGAPDARITYPEASLITPRFAPEGLKVYEGTFTIGAATASRALPRDKPVEISLRVQACDDEVCLRPATIPVTIPWK